MPVLNLILADLHALPTAAAPTPDWPRFAALERWLARADCAAISGGWREWLAGAAGGVSLAGLAPAVMASEAMSGTAAAETLWFATPLHYVTGIDSLRVHPAGLLWLTGAEQQQLSQDFARVFADSGWQLCATGGRELLLRGPGDLAARSVDPARLLGLDPAGAHPDGPGARALRGLSAELEMWLHEHPLNRERAARAALPVHALWLWGGGRRDLIEPRATPTRRASLQFWAEDIAATGLAARLGARVAPPPASLPAGAGAAGADHYAVLAVASADGAAGLAAIERDWLQPALAQWRRAHWSQLRLVVGDRCWTLPRQARWRWWRRDRPWWETLGTC